jgi:sugar phosphate isomerase/epimerase
VDLFVEVLKPLAEQADKLGVLLLIEPEPGLLIETTDQYVEIADRLKAPSIGLNFDVGHAYCMGEDLPGQIAKLAPQIRHYHFEDIAATRVHHHMVPGTGAIDFAEVVVAIQATGYDGWLTVELYPSIDDPDGAAKRAHEVLSPLLTSARKAG